MLALQRRVGHLERVEDTHVDLLAHVRQRPGDADEADLALVAELERLLQRAVLLELGLGEAAVELDQVEVVGLEQAQRVLDTGADVRGGVHVLAAGAAGNAAALRRQEVLGAPVRDAAPDQLLAAPVVDRRVDEVDARVEHGVEDRSRVGLVQRPQLHGAVAERGDFEARCAPGAASADRASRSVSARSQREV